jgi:hypothetical protein
LAARKKGERREKKGKEGRRKASEASKNFRGEVDFSPVHSLQLAFCLHKSFSAAHRSSHHESTREEEGKESPMPRARRGHAAGRATYASEASIGGLKKLANP